MMQKVKIDEIISVILLILITVIAFLQVVFRYVISMPLDWSEEVIRYSLIALIYVSTIVVIREEKMIRVEIIDLFVKNKAKKILDSVIYFVSGGFMLYLSYQVISLVDNARAVSQVTPALQMPFHILYGMECVTFALMGIMFMFTTIKKIKSIVKGDS